MKKAKEQVATIGENLLNLEINTIIDNDIRGTKTPPARLALFEIGRGYVDVLKQLNTGIAFDPEMHYGSYDTFKHLRDSIRWARHNGRSLVAEPNTFMVERIEDMSTQLVVVVFEQLENESKKQDNWKNDLSLDDVHRASPLKLGADQLTLIKKVWEIGVQEIAIQTVVQIDGDVMTRIQPKYAVAQQEKLLRLHNEGVQVSVDFWKDLMRIVVGFLESLFESVVRRR